MAYIKMSMFRRKRDFSGNEDIIGLDGDNIKLSIRDLENSIAQRVGSSFGGTINTTSVPQPTGDWFWITTEPGEYINFGGLTVPPETVAVISRVNGIYEMSYSSISFDPNKDQLLYPSQGAPVVGVFVDGSGRIFYSGNPLDKFSGFLPVSNEHPIVIEGHSTYYISSFHFYDENKNYISSLTMPNVDNGNGTIQTPDIPANAKFGAKNVSRSAGGNDDSTTVLVYTKTTVYDSLDRRSVANEVEETTVGSDRLQRKIGISKILVASYVYPNSIVNGNDGVTQGNTSTYARTRFIDVDGASKIIIGGVPLGLPVSRWFYDKNYQPISKVELLNGVIETIPSGAKFMAFTTKYMGVEITGDAYVWVYRTPSVDGMQFLANETHSTYVPANVVAGEEIRADGTIWTGRPNSAWSGHVPVIPGMDIELSGILTGFNAKAFYDADKNVIGTTSINNGVIKWDDVPAGTSYIGFNVKTPATGDSSATARANSIVRYSDGGVDPNTGNDFIAIPSIIPVVVGIQANIYTDNVRSNPVNDPTEVFSWSGASLPRNGTNPYVYNFRQTERSLQYQPTSGGQTVQMTASLRDRNYRVIAERKFAFTSVPANAGNGQRKVILLAGDSQIDPTYDSAKTSFAPFMKDMFDQEGYADMVFVGEEPMVETVYYDSNPANNRVVSCPTEGYGGRQINWFYESTSPFWNPAISDVDMVDYLDRMRNISGNPFGLQVGDTLDYFVFPMGVNDYAQGLTTEAIIGRMKTMQEKVWAGFPDCVFVIGMVTQGSKFWSMDLRRKWNIEYYNALIKEFETPSYSGKVFLSAAGLWTDNIYGSRQIRPIVEPYKRIVDSKTLLIQRLIQTQGLTQQQAEDKVNKDWGFLVEERVMERWMEEFPGTTDIVHSAWVSAMQQADCYYSTIKYLMQ